MERDSFFVGVYAIVIRENKILFGKRKNIYGAGLYGIPGGHLENGEKMEEAVARELFEETGMTADSFVFNNVINYPFSDRHYLVFSFIVVNPKGEPENKEPDVCEGWEWFPLKELPENILDSNKICINAYLDKRNFTESE